MTTQRPYYDFGAFLRQYFPFKVQKIAVNAGFTCPNRDGSKGVGGCTYCNNQTFNPQYCSTGLSVTRQIEEGKAFFRRKYPQMKFLAYFQAYTGTYADLPRLRALYEEALACNDVVGLIVGTRPDCMPDTLLDYLSDLSRRTFVLIEYGAETCHDATLALINRGHSWADTALAVNRTARSGILCGLHLILGLPGEDRRMILETADAVSALPVNTLKLHQLQLVRGTRLARQVADGTLSVPSWTPEEYITLCLDFIARTRPGIAFERFVSQSPDSLLISPRWGLKNYEFANLLDRTIRRSGIVQGMNFRQQPC